MKINIVCLCLKNFDEIQLKRELKIQKIIYLLIERPDINGMITRK